MNALIYLRHNPSGVIRTVVYDMHDSDEESLEFIWTEGNYACDCNRALFFARACGDADPSDRPCGETVYTALSASVGDKLIGLDEDPMDFVIEIQTHK